MHSPSAPTSESTDRTDRTDRRRPRAALLALALGAALALGCQDAPRSGRQLFLSPQTNPIEVLQEEELLVVANTTSGTVSVFDIRRIDDADHGLLAEIPVGLDPVSIARRPGSLQIYVANHVSDSVNVVDLELLDVVDTIQEIGPDGVTTFDAPSSVVFASPTRAFVALDDRDEVAVIDTDEEGLNPQVTARLPIRAQAPRAMAVAGGNLYVTVFESGNQTEFPSCAPDDGRLPRNGGQGIVPGDPDEGCLFATEVIETLDIGLNDEGNIDFGIALGTIFDFAAVDPNLGFGSTVVKDADLPDRDLWVFDAETLAPKQVVSGVGTLLYGAVAVGDRLWITNTDARNRLEGRLELDNRMFENRLTWLDCGGACGAPVHVDLDANGLGVPVPTPYGVRASPDGATLVASVAGSDGIPGLPSDPGVDIPGLVTLDANGTVIGHVQTGAIPQGLALLSGPGGPQTAFVLNTVDSTVSMVDVTDLEEPEVVLTFPVGDDPTPPDVREGRAMFMSARASSKGTFSCESCHPNGNIDQLIWIINDDRAAADLPNCDPRVEPCPEPRTTMPAPRGLRDTLPLHWLGNLADPFPNLPDQLDQPEDPEIPDCDLAVDGEVGCARDLVDAALGGPMCDQAGGCVPGPTGDPGALTDTERDAMAAFLMAVPYMPAPKRLPTDALTPTAIQGVSDFFTDEDGLGVGSPTGGNVGQAVGFAPITCADNSGGCHALPLGVATNSPTVGGFEAPTMRGMWDRSVIFSNGLISSEEWMVLAQACADGNPPGSHSGVSLFGFPQPNLLSGDPCALEFDPSIGGAIGSLGFLLNPFPGQPSGEEIYRPEIPDSPVSYMTERGQFVASFEAIFALAYGVRGGPMWEFLNEMGVGFSGLTGRQLSLTEDTLGDPEVQADLALIEQYADEGRVAAVARNREHGEFWFENGEWVRGGPPLNLKPADFQAYVIAADAVFTVTAELPRNMSIGGADRQPLLDIDPDDRAAEQIGDVLAIPEPSTAGGDTIRLGALYVEPGAAVIVNGARCDACTWVPGVAPTTGLPVIDLTIPQALPAGVHVVQIHNPDGWMSNEMPIIARDPQPQP